MIKTANRDELTATLTARHTEIHELLAAIAAKADAVDPETATWGHVGDMGYIIEQLRNAAGMARL